MSTEDRLAWSWFGLGLFLDAAILSLPAYELTLIDRCDHGDYQLMETIPFLGGTIGLAHLVLMPLVLMPPGRLTFRTVILVIVGYLTSTFSGFLGLVSGFLAGLLSLIPLGVVFLVLKHADGALMGSIPYFLPTPESLLLACVLLVGFISGGASCAFIIALCTMRLATADVPITSRSAAFGGGLAGLVALLVSAGLSNVTNQGTVPLMMTGLLTGLPHLLLIRRDLSRRPFNLAPLRMAAFRLMILLALVAICFTILVARMRSMPNAGSHATCFLDTLGNHVRSRTPP